MSKRHDAIEDAIVQLIQLARRTAERPTPNIDQEGTLAALAEDFAMAGADLNKALQMEEKEEEAEVEEEENEEE